MPLSHLVSDLKMGRFPEAELGHLVQEAQDLKALSYKFAMLSVAAGTLPGGGKEQAFKVRHALQDLLTAWRKLQNSDVHFLKGADTLLKKIVSNAFSQERKSVFTCFEDMAWNICSKLSRDDETDPAEFGELVRFVSNELSETINGVVLAAQQAAEVGRADVEKQARTDYLTGLPNRRALYEFFQEFEASTWPHNHVALVHIDLDKFKQINDTLGHAAGDKALKHIAAGLSSVVENSGFLARVGGDEFVLVFFGELSEARLAKFAERLISEVFTPFSYLGKEQPIHGSIGIASGQKSEGLTFDRYMNNADLALYAAKTDGPGKCRFFASDLRTKLDEFEELQRQIREGLKADEFEPFFQPQVEGRSGKLVGIEALARWHHPSRGVLTPFHFLGAAQEGGLLDDMDHRLMEQTFTAMRDWLQNGLEIPQISINLTASRLLNINLVDTLIYAADKADLDPARVGLEILESVMIDNQSPRMIENIRRLSDAGFKVELDDFGTGHASISNLKNFKVDRIKIDRSFVKDIHLYSDLAKITSAMIGLAHSLRVDALAEGVETPEERLVLNALGCDHIQGFGVAHPMPRQKIPDWIKKTQQSWKMPSRAKQQGKMLRNTGSD